ncbi:hypothetical protein SSCG_04630 [Streptomyces clavuligerus]|nr:hypothetical protein SSCG_04630 [Streptomyces clavuligerus]
MPGEPNPFTTSVIFHSGSGNSRGGKRIGQANEGPKPPFDENQEPLLASLTDFPQGADTG